MFKHCTRAPLHSFSARSFFSLLLSGSFFVDRVSRDENRIAVCGSNKNRRVVKCQPQSAATRVTRQGKHESKKEKKVSLQPRLSSIVDNFFRGREGKFSRLIDFSHSISNFATRLARISPRIRENSKTRDRFGLHRNQKRGNKSKIVKCVVR